MIIVKTRREIEIMKKAGKIVAESLDLAGRSVKPGMTTNEIDSIVEEYIKSKGALPAFKGYQGFPASICASINEEIVHGIPSSRKIKEGDIISIDIGSYIEGYYGDAARTFCVGKVDDEKEKLVNITKESFYEGIKYAREGYRLSDISHAIQSYVESAGFSVVRDYVGHGIGRDMHEDPQIPNFGKPNKGPRLQKGMVLAIEPMVNAGSYHVRLMQNNWTVVTYDGKPSAHYENSIVITDGEPFILTTLER